VENGSAWPGGGTRKVSHDAPPYAFDLANAPAGASLAAPHGSVFVAMSLLLRQGKPVVCGRVESAIPDTVSTRLGAIHVVLDS